MFCHVFGKKKNKNTQCIHIILYYTAQKQIYRVVGQNHGPSHVCAAVSVLLINTCNSIEAFTKTEIQVKESQSGGFLDFSIPDALKGQPRDDTQLLLNSMLLGLQGIAQAYPKNIQIEEVFSC